MAQLKSGFQVKRTARFKSSNYDWEEWLNGEPQALVKGVDYVGTEDVSVDDIERNLLSMFKINAKKRGLKPIIGEFANGKQPGDDEFIDQPKKGKTSDYEGKDGIILFAQGPVDKQAGQVYTLRQNARSAAWGVCKKQFSGKKYKDMPADEKKIRDDYFDEAYGEYILKSSYPDEVKTLAMAKGNGSDE